MPTESCIRTRCSPNAGKLCIEVVPNSKIAWISEELCIGCGICVKVRLGAGTCVTPHPSRGCGRQAVAGPAIPRYAHLATQGGFILPAAASRSQKCPFEAIMIINLPKNLEKETTHRYGPNSFKLHRWVRRAGGHATIACGLRAPLFHLARWWIGGG